MPIRPHYEPWPNPTLGRYHGRSQPGQYTAHQCQGPSPSPTNKTLHGTQRVVSMSTSGPVASVSPCVFHHRSIRAHGCTEVVMPHAGPAVRRAEQSAAQLPPVRPLPPHFLAGLQPWRTVRWLVDAVGLAPAPAPVFFGGQPLDRLLWYTILITEGPETLSVGCGGFMVWHSVPLLWPFWAPFLCCAGVR